MQVIIKKRSPCPVACVLDQVGDRWSLLIIRDLHLGKRYFDEFLNSPESIATNILSDRLIKLHDFGLIKKSVDKIDRRKTKYELTQKGIELEKILASLVKWGLKYIPGTKVFKQQTGLK